MEQTAQLWKDRVDAYANGSQDDDKSNDDENDDGSTADHQMSKNILVDSAAVNECYEKTQRDCEFEGIHLLPSIMLPQTSKSEVEDRLIECTRETKH